MRSNVHPTHIAGQEDCTPGDVYQDGAGVHPVYMAVSTLKPRPKAPKPLAWRLTRIRHWREFAGLTLETAAEKIASPPYSLKKGTTHTSLGRVENGKQIPSIKMIEALAHLYGTDVDSLLNRLPTIPLAAKDPDAGELAKIWESTDREGRRRMLRVVKAAIGS